MTGCNKKEETAGKLPHSRALQLKEQVEYAGGSIVSRTAIDSECGSVTLFAFDSGQSLSEHTAPFDALVQVLEGELKLTVGGKDITAGQGQSVLMPANVPHALEATTKTKMLLVMVKG